MTDTHENVPSGVTKTPQPVDMITREGFLESVLAFPAFRYADEELLNIFFGLSGHLFPQCSAGGIGQCLKYFLASAESEDYVRIVFFIEEFRLNLVKSSRPLYYDYEHAPPTVREAMIEYRVRRLKKKYAPDGDDTIIRSFALCEHTKAEIAECDEESKRHCLDLGLKTKAVFSRGQLNLVARTLYGVKRVTIVESYRFLIELAKRNLGFDRLIIKEFTEKEAEATNGKCLFEFNSPIPYEAIHNGRRDLESVEWFVLFNDDKFLARYRKRDLLERARVFIDTDGVLKTKESRGRTRDAGNFWNGRTAYTDAVDMLKKTAVKEYLKMELNLDSISPAEKNLVRYVDVQTSESFWDPDDKKKRESGNR